MSRDEFKNQNKKYQIKWMWIYCQTDKLSCFCSSCWLNISKALYGVSFLQMITHIFYLSVYLIDLSNAITFKAQSTIIASALKRKTFPKAFRTFRLEGTLGIFCLLMLAWGRWGQGILSRVSCLFKFQIVVYSKNAMNRNKHFQKQKLLL